MQTDQKGSKGVPSRWPKGWRTCPTSNNWKSRVFSPWRREGSEVPHHSIPVPKGQLHKGWRLSLHKEPHGGNEGQQVHVAASDLSI